MKNKETTSHQKVITLNELLEWKTKMLAIHSQFLENASKTTNSIENKYNIVNAEIVSHQLSFLERLILQASEKGE